MAGGVQDRREQTCGFNQLHLRCTALHRNSLHRHLSAFILASLYRQDRSLKSSSAVEVVVETLTRWFNKSFHVFFYFLSMIAPLLLMPRALLGLPLYVPCTSPLRSAHRWLAGWLAGFIHSVIHSFVHSYLPSPWGAHSQIRLKPVLTRLPSLHTSPPTRSLFQPLPI